MQSPDNVSGLRGRGIPDLEVHGFADTEQLSCDASSAKGRNLLVENDASAEQQGRVFQIFDSDPLFDFRSLVDWFGFFSGTFVGAGLYVYT